MSARVPATGFQPVALAEVELSRPLPTLSLTLAGGGRAPRALSLVRLHSQPLGLVALASNAAELTPAEYAPEIWQALGADILAHLREDGLRPIDKLDAAGLPHIPAPECLRERASVQAQAPAASVVVATRDRPASLARCLASLQSLHYPNFEIIVVDNAPRTHATADLVRRLGSSTPTVRYVREDYPGLAAAHNRGLQEVAGEHVAFTDDDVRVDPQWLAELVAGLRATQGAACVTGLILPAELETPAQVWLEQFAGFEKGFTRRVFDLAHHRPADPLFPFAAGRFGSGANMAFAAAALRDLGGFDPALGTGTPAMGGDDLAIFLQVIARGHRLVYQPGAIVYHWHRRDYAALRRQAFSYGVGLSAYLTKSLLDQPARIFDFARRAPRGLALALSSRSPKNRRKQAGFPAELTRLERWGMLWGPFAYLRSRWRSRQWGRGPNTTEGARTVPTRPPPLADKAS